MAFTATMPVQVRAHVGFPSVERKLLPTGRRPDLFRRHAVAGVSGGEYISRHPDAIRRREEAQARNRESLVERKEMMAQMQGRSFVETPENVLDITSVSDLKSHIALSSVDGSVAVVNYKARWCMKCARLQYTIKKTAKNNGKIRFLNVDVSDIKGELAMYCKQIGLKSIPHFQVFSQNEMISEGKWASVKIPGLK
ncbi:hypothetical protein BSKO_12429 [Bryopsis sp. KO-2023]|nr:hypothetical protein BSKO_12429 [Bryopsis sp. KO-2023]